MSLSRDLSDMEDREMPVKKKTARKRTLKPWEWAFLTGDESEIEPRSRDYYRLQVLKRGDNRPFMGGDRLRNEFLAIPEFKKIYDQHHEVPADAEKEK